MASIPFNTLVGKTFDRVLVKDDGIEFISDSGGDSFSLYHEQDCCEHVWIESIDGDLAQFLPGEEILEAYESYNGDSPPPGYGSVDDSYTWSFYTIRTMLDTFVIRFFGTSNGYYSETATLCYFDKEEYDYE